MGIPQFSLIFGDKEIATSMGKIGESLGWGQSNILGNNGDKSPKKSQISKWGQDSISEEFAHPSTHPFSKSTKEHYSLNVSMDVNVKLDIVRQHLS